MIGVLFDVIGHGAHAGWNLLTGLVEMLAHGAIAVLELLWSLLVHGLDMGFQVLRWVANLIFAPVTAGLDQLWDFGIQGCWNWGNLFFTIFLTLLGVCAILALAAVGGTVYRRLKEGGSQGLRKL